MYYKYEFHCHDRLCSACAENTPEEMVDAYVKKGYSGMVFTNHFLMGNHCVPRNLSWIEKIECYENAYLRAKKHAPKDFTVFFGIEHYYGDGKEVLTYGITPEFLKAHENIHLMPLKEYAKLVRENGGFLSQAHPFRKAGYINPNVMPQIDCLDAMETFNFFTSEKDNKEGEIFAKKYDIYQMSGGDIHNVSDPVGMAGMAFEKPILTSEELVKALKERKGKRIINGEVER